MSSSLGGGISGSGNSRGSRPSAAHARTRLSLPLDDSDNDIPFMPTPSTMSHTRTRKPFDLDSDDESLPATVLNGSYLDDNMSAVSYHRSRHGSIDDRQKDRESERVRQRELGRQENSRSRNRPRDHQRDIDRNEREDSHGARSSMGGGFVAPYPEQYDMPTGGSYDYYDNKATPHPPQPQDNYHQELSAPQQGANYRQRASPAPEREKPRSSHQASIANETGYQSDRHSQLLDQYPVPVKVAVIGTEAVETAVIIGMSVVLATVAQARVGLAPTLATWGMGKKTPLLALMTKSLMAILATKAMAIGFLLVTRKTKSGDVAGQVAQELDLTFQKRTAHF
ncbi:hypothetical protein CFO_g979 [Ceratocystis platani]|uniref:Uncharacterized protein n=1 Tax=Ceratocystis fimbriata f. sp. platani TaxID=88771 RepID=A0A0F8D1P7_CERFI|nr:hypothetical protein CFO_g979 [Ceratocystis platani]